MPPETVRPATTPAEAEARRWRLVLPTHPLAGRAGDRLGHGTGSSLEFMDFRDYVPGDDLRHVDWRAYARTDQWKVRLFREETSPSLDLVLDVSASMAATDGKRVALLDLAAAIRVWSTAHGGRLRVLEAGGGDVADPARIPFDRSDPEGFSPRVPLRPRALRMLISDFLRPDDPAGPIRRLAANASHLTVVQLLDPWERDPEPEGERTLIDAEDDASRLDVVLDRRTVARYRERLARLTASVERATRRVGGTFAALTAAPLAAMCRDDLLPAGVVEPA